MRYIFLFSLLTTIFSCGNEPEPTSSETINITESKEDKIQQGAVLYNVNCKLCHSINTNTPTGLAPVLDSVWHYWPENDVLAQYIKDAPAMMHATPRTRKLYKEWKDKPQMPAFNGLSHEEIANIIAFLYAQKDI